MASSAQQLAPETLPSEFPALWASDWGQDRHGLWMGLTIGEVRQAFRWIPPGVFKMGSPPKEAERLDDETQHEVILNQGLWLAETTCTQALWEVVMGDNPSEYKGAERPVEQVSWELVMAFVARLNERVEGLNLRLPTEAEWEYGCRVGTQTPFCFGQNITTEEANFNGTYPYAGGAKGENRGETVDVKALPCNGWGLYQMHGNVWEWCSDWYGEYPVDKVQDPKGPESGERRVLRGGGWYTYGRHARSAQRYRDLPDDRYHGIGFRLARGQ